MDSEILAIAEALVLLKSSKYTTWKVRAIAASAFLMSPFYLAIDKFVQQVLQKLLLLIDYRQHAFY